MESILPGGTHRGSGDEGGSRRLAGNDTILHGLVESTGFLHDDGVLFRRDMV